MTREKMLAFNMAHDIIAIKYDIEEEDYDFLQCILLGDGGWEPYENWTDEQLERTTKDLKKDPTVLMQMYGEEIRMLAKKLEKRFIAD